jgi:probable rRNA maturation factor
MITSILNQQTKHPVNQPRLQKLTDWLGRKLEALSVPDAWNEVCAVLVDDEGITQPNREYFGKNRPTDVISFRYDPVPGEGKEYSGDLIINVERAMKEGTARGRTDYELALYLAHGFDHLSGAEDDSEEKRKKMRATETAWLRAAGNEGLIEGLFE